MVTFTNADINKLLNFNKKLRRSKIVKFTLKTILI